VLCRWGEYNAPQVAMLREAHQKRWMNLLVVQLRLVIGFAFVPSGLKKVLNQPFTDPANTGSFHEFLHAFYATGAFYQFVGLVQLTSALLLMTQTFATVGALMAMPVIAAISVFCWSTHVIPTAIVATLMALGTLTLLAWDFNKWRGVLRPASSSAERPGTATEGLPVDPVLWRRCGTAILALYAATCLVSGGIYRPRGVDLGNPAFYIFPLVAVFPVVTIAVEQARRRKKLRAATR
jgi:uncharacterized membrane protein YphA (DoxX/SURF4 family)